MLRILIVDDDPLQVELLVEVFRINNYSVIGFHSAYRALDYLENSPIDIVLSDIRMQGMDGVEFCQKILMINPAIRVILMTAYADDELVWKGIQAGALIALSKPLQIDKLLNHIAQFKAL